MTYKKKLFCLLALIFCLISLYGATFFFDPEVSSRNSNLSWLENRFVDLADRIEIFGSNGRTLILRINNVWVISDGNVDYPVKQIRVEELFRDLSRRKNYPLRSSTSEPGIYGLGEGASRIIIRGGAGLPLLDLLIGYSDVSGREIYLRRTGQREIRSGEDIFSIYTESARSFWYDLRLFPDLSVVMVQRVHVFPPIMTEESPFTLSRRNNNWINENSGALVPRAESWLRTILDTQGESFADPVYWNPAYWEAEGSIILELEDGSARIFRIGPPDSYGSRFAVVSDSDFTYSLTEWTVRRVWSFSF